MFTMIASLGSIATIGSTAESEGDIIVESNMTWNQDMSIDQNVRVINGGSLTISDSSIIFQTGVDILIDESSSINIQNSNLIADSPPTGLAGFGYCDESNRSAILVEEPEPSRPQGVRVTLSSIDGYTLDGVVAYFGNETKDLSGSESSFQLAQGFDEVWVGLVGPACYPVSLSEVTVSGLGPGAGGYTALAADMEKRNMMVFGDAGFTINIDGKLRSSSSSVMGGKISSSGEIWINDTFLDRVGPILLIEDEASIFLGGDTNFTNSTNDHDVRAMVESTIFWDDGVNGSGGLTDKWERRLSGQHLVFDAQYVAFEVSGLHNMNRYSNISNEDGFSYIKGGRERVVEIAWSEDNTWEEERIWREDAMVTITEYRTAWNPEVSGISDYGGGTFPLGLDKQVLVRDSLPRIKWVSVNAIEPGGEAVTESEIGKSVKIEAIIANTGTAAASVPIDCNLSNSNMPAEISPTYPNAKIGPGQNVSISFTWRNHSPGNEAINCRVLTPTQLVDDLAFGGGEMMSHEVNWIEEGDESGLPYFIPGMIALFLGIAFSGYMLVANSQVEDFE